MEMTDMMREVVDKQIATYQDGHSRNFMDVYIKEIKESERVGEKTGFLYDQLVMICTDFLFPSISAMQTQVAFLLRFLLHNPKVMETIQEEIENVVGSGRLPELDDRVKWVNW